MADLSSDLFRQLAQFAYAPVSSYQKSSRTSDFDIAMQILKKSNIDFSQSWSLNKAAAVSPSKQSGGKGALSRIVDLLSRPLYGTANTVKSEIHDLGNFTGSPSDFTAFTGLSGLGLLSHLPEAYRGITGQEKTTTRDITPVIEKETGLDLPQKGLAGFATNLAGDVALDPLTYVPVGGLLKAGVRGSAKALGKEAPNWALPKYLKNAVPAPKEETGSKVLTQQDLFNKTNSFNAVSKAVQDAPAVSMALDESTKRAAVAEHALSPQQAALAGKQTVKEGETILKGAEASPAAVRTYKDLMNAITYQAKGEPGKAVARNANKLSLAVSSQTQKYFRGQGGKFLKYGTELPTVGKIGLKSSRYPARSEKIVTSGRLGLALNMAHRLESKGLAPTAPSTGFLSGLEQTPKVAPKTAIAPKGIFGPVNTQVTKAINSVIDEPTRVLKPGETVSQRNVTHGMMARVATWAGQKDLRPIVLDKLSSARARAAARIDALQRAFKGFSDDELLQAWKVARNALPRDLVDERISGLADELTGQMENMFRSRAIPESLAKGNSVAMRTGMAMKDINKMLKRYNIPFRFTNGSAMDPITNKAISYGKGTNWLISWETHAPKNAAELKRFLFGVQTATEQLSAHYAFLDDVASRFGKTARTGAYKVKVKDPRLVDYYFPAEVADQLSTALNTMDRMYVPKSAVAKFVAKSVSMWKGGVTIYNPRHHIANGIGDAFLMWMAGVNDPRVFSKSMKVMLANKGQYKDLATVDKLVGADAVKNAMEKGGAVVTRNKSGQEFTAEQVYVAAFNYGLLQKAHIAEDIAAEGLPFAEKLGRLSKPFGGKVHNTFAGASEFREHYIKMAHFIDAVSKSRGKNTKEIFENAAHQVRKWHPDGLDLTKEEQALRTWGIPFYSWLRKSTPLLIEGAVMNPQKAFTAYPKVNFALQNAMGIEGTSLDNPYPADQLFPSWLRDDLTPVLGKPGMKGLAGMIGGLGRQANDDKGNPLNAYTLFGPTNPMQDFFTSMGGFRSFGETKDSLLSTINPMARIPLELQQGRELYTGIPTKDRKKDYLTSQIPMVSQFARMTNLGPFGPTGRAEKYGIGNREATLNWLTNANITGSGPFIKSAEFEQMSETRKQNEKYRKFAESIGYPMKKKGKIPQWIKDLYDQRQGQ